MSSLRKYIALKKYYFWILIKINNNFRYRIYIHYYINFESWERYNVLINLYFSQTSMSARLEITTVAKSRFVAIGMVVTFAPVPQDIRWSVCPIVSTAARILTNVQRIPLFAHQMQTATIQLAHITANVNQVSKGSLSIAMRIVWTRRIGMPMVNASTSMSVSPYQDFASRNVLTFGVDIVAPAIRDMNSATIIGHAMILMNAKCIRIINCAWGIELTFLHFQISW